MNSYLERIQWLDGEAIAWCESVKCGWATICIAIKLDRSIKGGRKRVVIANGWDGQRWSWSKSLEQLEGYRPGLAEHLAQRLRQIPMPCESAQQHGGEA